MATHQNDSLTSFGSWTTDSDRIVRFILKQPRAPHITPSTHTNHVRALRILGPGGRDSRLTLLVVPFFTSPTAASPFISPSTYPSLDFPHATPYQQRSDPIVCSFNLTCRLASEDSS
ncbi:hypothetical protein QCA50_012640 [Cerrena zonata]|uniref:Uncharacterized protein n=1 Tax=Cerrena zonata TaxID=2478898 RepID=A0AAW0G3T2_9APHY